MPQGRDRSALQVGSFPEISGLDPVAARDLPKVCIVTGELVGPFNNGGLGTSTTGLAELLAAYGAEVVVVYTGQVSGDAEEWRRRYGGAGIVLVTPDQLPQPYVIGPLANYRWTNACSLLAWLKNRHFDIIHFNDTVGEGAYCLLSKRLGLGFEKTLLCLALHSPTEWILESNRHPANWLGFAMFTTGERLSIACADLLWGPSRYLVEWIHERGYQLPGQVFQQQYVIPTGALFSPGRGKCEQAAMPPPDVGVRVPGEIVFFGRLEERKGIRLFMAAISRLGEFLRSRDIEVVFMGKSSSVGGVQAGEFLAARSAAWPFRWRVEEGFGQQEALAYLRSRQCLAVIASPVDNSPCTLYEVLQNGVPFLATRRGGIPELLHQDHHGTHLFDYSVDDLSDKLRSAIERGIGPARAQVSVAENQRRWLGFHLGWRQFLPPPNMNPTTASWAVLVDHAGSAEDCDRTMHSARGFLGDMLVGEIVVRRDLAPLGGAANESTLIIDEINGRSAQDALEFCASSGASCLLCLRSGAELAGDSASRLTRAMASDVDALVPFSGVAEHVLLPNLAGSAVLHCLEGEFDGGAIAIALDRPRVREVVAELDLDRLYLGFVSELHAVDAFICPYPENIVRLPSWKACLVPRLGVERAVRAFAAAPHRELYQMLALSSHYYRSVFPIRYRPPEPGTVEAGLDKQLASAGRQRWLRSALQWLGERNTNRLRRLLARLRSA